MNRGWEQGKWKKVGNRCWEQRSATYIGKKRKGTRNKEQRTRIKNRGWEQGLKEDYKDWKKN